ncbi:unnamed protein product, partial [Didymodactylos carnosus]
RHEAQQLRVGGVIELRDLDESDIKLFEDYRDIIERKIREQHETLPSNFKIMPIKVQTQVVAGTNYYFRVILPNEQYGNVRIFVPLRGAPNNNSLTSADQREKNVTIEPGTTKKLEQDFRAD